MPAKLLDGEALALKIKANLKSEIEKLKESGIEPHLVAVQVGENQASKIYTKQQKRNCEEMGVSYELKEIPGDVSQEELKGVNPEIADGIIKVRKGDIFKEAGYDGVYGKIKIFSKEKRGSSSNQNSLF